MDITEAIRNRRSIRGFKPEPVPKQIIEELLNICIWAPSSRNQQSWEFAVLGGSILEDLKSRLSEKIKSKEKEKPDLPPAELTGPYLKRANELTNAMIRFNTAYSPPGPTDRKNSPSTSTYL